jgi:phosphoglycolate phosphatase
MISPRAVVFDLDGTLLDTRGDIAFALNAALQHTGRAPMSVDEIIRNVGDGARTLCARSLSLPENDPAVDVLVERFLAFYAEHPVAHTKWMPGAARVLDAVQPMPIALCTNKSRAVTEAILGALGIRTRFAAIVAGGDMPEKKPAPGPIFACARALGVDSEALIVIGDGDQDVLAGRRAGSRTVAVANGFCPRERLLAARPDILLEQISEFPAILQRWAESTIRWQ